MKLRKIKTKDKDNFLEDSRHIERNLLAEVIKSRSIYKRVATASCAVTMGMMIITLAAVKQEKPAPVVLRVDKTTGEIERLLSTEVYKVSTDEAIDKNFIYRFVINYEGYNYKTIQMTYNTAVLLSTEDVGLQLYNSLYGNDKRLNLMGDKVNITPTVSSIQIGSSDDKTNGLARVRFTTREESSTGGEPKIRKWIAELSYTYNSKLIMTEKQRLENPLGFQVRSYKVDADGIE